MTNELQLDVLGYKEDDGWVAHALSMDIVGYADTFAGALSDLRDLVRMQFDYAVFKKDPSLLTHPAPIDCWRLFHDLKGQALASLVRGSDHQVSDSYRIAQIPCPLCASGDGYTATPPAHLDNS